MILKMKFVKKFQPYIFGSFGLTVAGTYLYSQKRNFYASTPQYSAYEVTKNNLNDILPLVREIYLN